MSKKVANNIDRGLWTEYGYPGDDYFACAYAGAEDGYVISFHQGTFPAFETRDYDTLAELVTAMRGVEPDLRKWKLMLD